MQISTTEWLVEIDCWFLRIKNLSVNRDKKESTSRALESTSEFQLKSSDESILEWLQILEN